MTAALCIGALIGFTSMLLPVGYLWRGWARSIDRHVATKIRCGDLVSLNAVRRSSLAEAHEELARLTPLAEMGAKKRAKDARYRAKVRGSAK